MTETAYQDVEFRTRVRVLGSPKLHVAADKYTTLTRVREDGGDDLIIRNAQGSWEVPWSNIASARRIGECVPRRETTIKPKGPKEPNPEKDVRKAHPRPVKTRRKLPPPAEVSA